MTLAAVDVTLRVGASGRAAAPGSHGDVPRTGALPFTGTALLTLVALAIAMVVLGTLFLLHARQED